MYITFSLSFVQLVEVRHPNTFQHLLPAINYQASNIEYPTNHSRLNLDQLLYPNFTGVNKLTIYHNLLVTPSSLVGSLIQYPLGNLN